MVLKCLWLLTLCVFILTVPSLVQAAKSHINSDAKYHITPEQLVQELADEEPREKAYLRKSTEPKDDGIKELEKSVYGFLGTRYRLGGTSQRGVDCSGFIQKAFRELEVSLPRTAREQFKVGSTVAPGDLQKGDLLFFRTYASYPSHVGIYLGNNKMIHASFLSRRVVISPINAAYFRTRYLGAKRIAKAPPEVFKLDDLIVGDDDEADVVGAHLSVDRAL